MKLRDGWQRWQAMPGVELDLFHWEGPPGGKRVLITAGIHGDEYEGPAAVIEWANRFDSQQLLGRVTAIPVANPLAYHAGTRTNPDDGLNLARCFPGKPEGRPTEQLAAALFTQFAEGINYLIDLHSGGVEYLFLPVSGFYGDPSPDNSSLQAALEFGLPAVWQLPVTDGVLSCEAWKRGTVAIGNEYLGGGQLSPAGVEAYCDGIERSLIAWGLYDGAKRADPVAAQVLLGDWQLAQAHGLFRSRVALGQRVCAGQPLAVTLLPSGAVIEEFFAQRDGVVGALRNKAYIREGNWAVLVLTESHGR